MRSIGYGGGHGTMRGGRLRRGCLTPTRQSLLRKAKQRLSTSHLQGEVESAARASTQQKTGSAAAPALRHRNMRQTGRDQMRTTASTLLLLALIAVPAEHAAAQ